MGTQRRTMTEVEKIQNQIHDLDMKGYTQMEIAEKVDISQQLVSHYLIKIKDAVKRRLNDDPVTVGQQQLDKLRLSRRKTWDAIERHEQHLQTHPQEWERIEAAIERKHWFLLKCTAEENKLLGAYQKQDRHAATTVGEDSSSWTPQEYNARLARLKRHAQIHQPTEVVQ